MTNPPPNPYYPAHGQGFPAPQLPIPDLEGKVRLLAIFYGIMGGLALLIILGVAIAVPIVYANHPEAFAGDAASGTPAPRAPLALVETVLVAAGLLGAALPLTTCYGLAKVRPWARTLALVNAFLILLSFPFGTALGGYTLFLFFQSGAREAFTQLSRRFSPAF